MSRIIIALVLLVIVLSWFLYSLGKRSTSPAPSVSSSITQPPAPPSQPETSEKRMVVSLASQNNSGETGSATFFEENDKVRVILSMRNFPDNSQPAHIHTGTCESIGGIKYPLRDVVNGVSETIIDTTMEQLAAEESLAINVHKSESEIGTYLSCGDFVFLNVYSR